MCNTQWRCTVSGKPITLVDASKSMAVQTELQTFTDTSPPVSLHCDVDEYTNSHICDMKVCYLPSKKKGR